jgi:hypothetical protein
MGGGGMGSGRTESKMVLKDCRREEVKESKTDESSREIEDRREELWLDVSAGLES